MLHIATNDFSGGAAIAAHRLHRAGVISKMLLRSHVANAEVITLQTFISSAFKFGRHWLVQKFISTRWEEEVAIGRFRLGGEVHYAAYN